MSGDAVAAALAVLADVKARCRTQDMRTPAVLAALEYLEARASIVWPFVQFRRALIRKEHEIDADGEGHWQLVNASLNAVRRAVGQL